MANKINIKVTTGDPPWLLNFLLDHVTRATFDSLQIKTYLCEHVPEAYFYEIKLMAYSIFSKFFCRATRRTRLVGVPLTTLSLLHRCCVTRRWSRWVRPRTKSSSGKFSMLSRTICTSILVESSTACASGPRPTAINIDRAASSGSDCRTSSWPHDSWAQTRTPRCSKLTQLSSDWSRAKRPKRRNRETTDQQRLLNDCIIVVWTEMNK